MDTKALRQKILDLAIRGKLVPQDPADEPASVLLERIRAEKQQMVKDGKLKAKDIKNDTVIYVGEDNLHYEKFSDGTVKCIEDEIPFEIPDGWAWARVFNVSTDLPYGTAKRSYATGKIAVLRMGNLQNGEIDYRDLVYSSDEEDIAKYSLYPGDLLFNRTNSAELVGKTAIYRGSVPAIYAGYLIRIHPLVNPEYLNAVMNSQYAKQYCYYVKADSVSQSNINANKLGAFLIPIPPANEQEAISKEVSVFLPIISALQEHRKQVEELCAEAKSEILDLAIRGKLVPQDPADEPASVLLERIRADKEEQIKAGKIKRDKKESFIFRGEDNSYYEKIGDEVHCIDNEIPFPIPQSWKWCRLKECCLREIKRGKAPKYSEKGQILVFAQKCNQKNGTINLGLAQLLDPATIGKYPEDEFTKDGDVIINSTGTGTLGRVGLYKDSDNFFGLPVVPDSHITTVRCHPLLNSGYIYTCIKSYQHELEEMGEGSTNQKELRPQSVQDLLIPIPPVNEQARIKNKMEQIATCLLKYEQSLI